MITRVVMPKLTDTMEEGVLVSWKKHEGDPVEAGDILAEIETDKAVMDLEAFGSGILRRILVNEGETVDSGTLIAVIGEADEDIESAIKEAQEADNGVAEPSEQVTPPLSPSQEEPVGMPPSMSKTEVDVTKTQPSVSPRAKALAEKSGVDLSKVKGSGPGGRIVERDVLERQNVPEEPPSAFIEKPLSQMRKAIARTTTESKSPVPHFYLTIDIGMSEAEKLKKHMRKIRKSPVSLTALILKAATESLSRHPEINVSFAGESLRQHQTIDIGIAVALEEGLMTPVVRNCARHSLWTLAEEWHGLLERAKNKQLQPEEYAGATFSLSNLGMYGIENFIAVLMPPQAASLAIGAVQSVPIVEGKELKIDRRMKVTLSCDHRVLDGAQGAKFLQTFKHILENPLELVFSPE